MGLVEVIYKAWLVGLIFGFSWSNGRASNLDCDCQMSIYMGPMEALRPRARVLARACSFRSARSVLPARLVCTWRNLARLRAAGGVKLSTSLEVIMPSIPEPVFIRDRSTPLSDATLFAAGLAKTLSPDL